MALGEALFKLLRDGVKLPISGVSNHFYYNEKLEEISLDELFVRQEGERFARAEHDDVIKSLEANGSDTRLVFDMMGERTWKPTYIDKDFIADIRMFIQKGWVTLGEY